MPDQFQPAWLPICVLLAGLALPGLAAAQTPPHAAATPPPHGTTVTPPHQPVREKPHHKKPAHAEHATPAAKPGATPPAPALVVPMPTPTPEAAGLPPAKSEETNKGSVTGLPLPRFATLRSDDVNFRSGPGTRYPIDWIYKRRDLPVEIEREFDVWRLVEDSEGVKGWVHSSNLYGRRGIIVTGAQRTLRRAADPQSAVVAQLDPGVVGRLAACEPGAEWCQVQVGDYRGWLRRAEFWGSFPGEAVQ